MVPIIETDGLTKRYEIGSVVTNALNGVTLTIERGSYSAIEGKSGSGKSTLLHMLSLLDRPTGGRVLVQGEDTSTLERDARVALRLRTFGYVFQDYALLPELSALENVLLPHFMMTGCFGTCRRKGEQLLERVGLANRLHNLPSQLSGGEQQRVAIARALVNEPEVLFADEPTANLDSETGSMIIELIEELHHEGLTVLMVTHEPEYAARAKTRIVLADGRITSS